MSCLHSEAESFYAILKQSGSSRGLQLKPVIFSRCSNIFFLPTPRQLLQYFLILITTLVLARLTHFFPFRVSTAK